MKIYIASDHAGFELKSDLVDFLKALSCEVVHCGAHEYAPNDDYPEFISQAAKEVSDEEAVRYTDTNKHSFNTHEVRGIVIGGSGQGEAIVANRYPFVRAAVYYGGNEEIVKLSRLHNDANILSLGARFLTTDQARKAVELWLNTPFERGRHEKRIDDIEHLRINYKDTD